MNSHDLKMTPATILRLFSPGFWLLCFLLVLAFTLTPYPLEARKSSSGEDLEQSLAEQQAKAERQKGLLKRLTQQERALYKNLAAIEDRMIAFERDVAAKSSELNRIRTEEAELKQAFGALNLEKDQTQKNLRTLLIALWPIEIAKNNAHMGMMASWGEADRQFTWLSHLTSATENQRRRLESQADALTENLKEQERLKTKVLAKLDEVERAKDKLLADKLIFLRQVQTVRAKKLAGAEQLNAVMHAIETMRYELQTSTSSPDIKIHKGSLGWPANGQVVIKYNPAAKPPHRGISIALGQDVAVRAVSPGKVVHNDQLRGFGRVVILLHGEGYYSLYAFLADSSLDVGQKINKGDQLGTAGFYPEAKSVGVYFELRFHQKAVNPLIWLSSAGG